jgi:PadR family transcriptional regulator AphA
MSPRRSAPLALEYVLLGLLDRQPMHGYDLYKEITTQPEIALVWSVKQSQLYALLDKLEERGLLASTLIPGEVHPNRKEFHPTPEGHKAFLDWMQSPVHHGRDMRQEFLARLYFAFRNGKENALELLRQQRQVCLSWKGRLERQFQAQEGQNPFARLIFDYRLGQINAMLDWLETCGKELSE